jgi:hypothetical protein
MNLGFRVITAFMIACSKYSKPERLLIQLLKHVSSGLYMLLDILKGYI